MFFEIPYSPCIRDSTARRRIIAQSHNYHAVGKSKACLSIPRLLLFHSFFSFHIILNRKSPIDYFNGIVKVSMYLSTRFIKYVQASKSTLQVFLGNVKIDFDIIK